MRRRECRESGTWESGERRECGVEIASHRLELIRFESELYDKRSWDCFRRSLNDIRRKLVEVKLASTPSFAVIAHSKQYNIITI